jgi:hypothetical protein
LWIVVFKFFYAPPSLIMVYCCVFLLAEALVLEAVAVKMQLTDACFCGGADNFSTIVGGAGVEGGGGVDGSDGSAYGIGVNNFCDVCWMRWCWKGRRR